MFMKSPTIVFMGTAGFAVSTLEALVHEGFHVAAVVTAPDKPSGRGQKIRFSPVKEAALKFEIPLLQPVNLKDPDFQFQLQKVQPDLQVVVAFRMLPESVWALPKLGTINLHASLLPQYRGAAPINHAVINGEKETGVTTFIIDKEIDTGKILFKEKITINDNESAGELHDRLMMLGAKLAVKTVNAIISGVVEPIPQTELMSMGESMKKAPKIFKEDCKVNWNKPTIDVYNFIRGMSPSPCAFSLIRLKNNELLNLKIFQTQRMENQSAKTPGSISTDNKKQLGIFTSDGIIYLTEVQLQGKKRMKIDEFLRGFDATEIKQFE